MAGWVKTVLAVAVLVVPGGFLMLLAYGSGRVVHSAWQDARARAPGRKVNAREVLASLSVKDVVREVKGVGQALTAPLHRAHPG